MRCIAARRTRNWTRHHCPAFSEFALVRGNIGQTMHMQEFGIVLTCGTTDGQRVLQRRALRVLDLECLVSRQCLCEGDSPLLARLGFYLLNLIASLIAKFAEPVLRRLAVQLCFEW